MSNSIIRIRHSEAQSFFDMMKMPDPSILQARDKFFDVLSKNCQIRTEGTSIVMDIPDSGFELSLFSEDNSKSTVDNPSYLGVNAEMTLRAYIPASSYSFSDVGSIADCLYDFGLFDFDDKSCTSFSEKSPYAA